MKKKKKDKKGKPTYPIATMAFYGPDNKHASKVAVGIVKNANAEPEPLRRWMSEFIDVRADEKIGQEIDEFLKNHSVKQVVYAKQIIDCPHEEGKDYPEKMKCPFCPFWANRDRFTHEIENEN